MLRRAAPALAPAAWLLLAGLLSGGGVWASRGKRRAGAGPGGVGAGAGGRRSRAASPGGAPDPRVAAARVWGDVPTGARVGPRPPQRLRAGVQPGERPCTCVVCSLVHQAGGARSFWCVLT